MRRSEDIWKKVRFDELAVFTEVASAGSIAAAAKNLGVPKSTVGRALSRVERDLGVALVRRMARGPALTEQGRTLASLATPHIAGLRDATMAMGRNVTEPYGTLRVTAPVDIGQLVLGPIAATFIARYPRVRLDVDLSLRMVDLASENFDAALRVSASTLPSSSLVARRLAKLDLGLYASSSYLARRPAPKAPRDLTRHDHVIFQGRDGRNVLTLEGPTGTSRVTVEGRLQANEFFFLREALAADAGIGPLPVFVAKPDVEAGRLRRVLPSYRLAGATAYLLHPPARPLPRKLEVFRDFLLETAPPLFVGSDA